MDAAHDRFDLFPPIEPFEHGMLDLDGRHQMYWEQSGNPEGVPALFLHGGPGAGAGPVHRRFFDPTHYRIVVFDQRGAGRSRPFADITDNTTAHLIADIETLRRHLGIDRWLVFGGSWGASLALATAIARPERCRGLVLRGVFLGTERELDWFLGGMGMIFPEAWRAFVGFLPEDERGDVLGAYHARLTDADPAVHLPAAQMWSGYENACSNLLPRNDAGRSSGGGAGALDLARIEAHYFANRMFLSDNELLAGIDRIRPLPGVIVQGRYDMICPIATADTLARAWPEAEYVIVPDAGHSALEQGIRSALVRATEKLKAQI